MSDQQTFMETYRVMLAGMQELREDWANTAVSAEEFDQRVVDYKKSIPPPVSGADVADGGMFSGILKNIGTSIAEGIDSVWERLTGLEEERTREWFGQTLKIAVKQGAVTQEGADFMLEYAASRGVLGSMYAQGMIMFLNVNSIKQHLEAAGQKVLQNEYEKLRPSLPGPGDIFRGMFIDPDKKEAIDEILAKHGYTNDAISLMHLAYQATYPYPQALQLHMRGKLSDEMLDRRMAETGLTPARAEELKHLAEHVPSIADIITFISREAFEEDQVALMGLDDDFPDALLEWGAKIGLKKDAAKLYWRSHWQQPSLGQIMEMLHRDEIDSEDLDHFYKVVEVPPYWRDRLTNIAYRPYTRVDSRRMHDLGVLNDEQLIQSYKDIGYDEEKAGKMADFTTRYNRNTERTATRKLVEKSFAQGSISESQAREYLTGAGIKKSEVDFYIAKVNYQREIEYIDQEVDLTHTEYVSGFIDETVAESRLAVAGIDVRQVKLYIRSWNVEIRKKQRKPSREDLQKLLFAGIIHIDEWIETMSLIGYPTKYINWYMNMFLQDYLFGAIVVPEVR